MEYPFYQNDNRQSCVLWKIAFGRRTREKVKGTKNVYRQVHQDDYILADGQHDAIISEELWDKAHEKREITGVKSPSKIGRDRVHLLSGILKCPKCGGPMYTNKHAWTLRLDGLYDIMAELEEKIEDVKLRR